MILPNLHMSAICKLGKGIIKHNKFTIHYSLTQNTIIKAFRFRAQAIFSLLEKKHPPGLHNLSSSIFFIIFYIMGTQGIYICNKKVLPRAVLRN